MKKFENLNLLESHKIIEVPENKVMYDQGWIFTNAVKNKCEVNAYNYAKERDISMVKGYVESNGHRIEHWWVYDGLLNRHIEVSPVKNLTGIRKGFLIPASDIQRSKSLKHLLPVRVNMNELV